MKTFILTGLVAAVACNHQASSGSECATSTDHKFTITTVNATKVPTEKAFARRQLDGILVMSLEDGKLTDQAGRTGYIASNYQFQFDSPVQANARESEGFGLCSNGSLSLKGSTFFYQCKSGDFYNLYSESIGAQCLPIHIQAITKNQAPSVTQISDGQPQASAPVVTQISDGQPQASAPVVTQISDGQPQVRPPVETHSPEIPSEDCPPTVTQISDGQPQASAPIMTQISDGQPQTSAPVVSQISDGQPQASAPQASAPPNEIPTSATTISQPEYTGAAVTGAASIGALAAGFLAFLPLL